MTSQRFRSTFEKIPDRRKQFLLAFLQGQSNANIAKSLVVTEATVRKHIENLCDDFGIEQEFPDSRKPRRDELLRLFALYMPELLNSPETQTPEARQTVPELALPVSTRREDWGSAPDVEPFYDHAEELKTLQQWITQDECRLIAVVGMTGIGKTALCVKVAEQIYSQFDCFIWRSLRDAPSLTDLLADLIRFVEQQPDLDLPESERDRLSRWMAGLRQHRCLVVLDGLDAVLQEGDRTGQSQAGYEGYGAFLKRIAEERHRSCLLLNSREKPKEVALLEGNPRRVRSLRLEGLLEEAQDIFRDYELSDEDDWNPLIRLYSGNPRALRMVSAHIKEACNGSVTRFIELGTLVLDEEFRQILDRQFDRLSDLEKQILCHLAKKRQPMSLEEIYEELQLESKSDLVQALTNLSWRSLLDSGLQEADNRCGLQPAIEKFVRRNILKV